MHEDAIRNVQDRLERTPALDRVPEHTTLAARMQQLGVPGVSIAVIDRGEIAWARTFGLRRVDGNLPMQPDTMLQAGSVSKPVAAMAVMRCVQDGTLDLDADVNDYLTSWKVPPNGDWQPRITLRNLLSHSAGLTVHGFPGYNRRAPIPTTPQILDGDPPANTLPVRVNIIPGTRFRYSGGGTTVAQLVLTDMLRKPFPTIMRELVLEPLEMHDSTYEQPLPESRRAQAASGYRAGGGVVDGGWHVYPEMAAAGLWTTPTDLARLTIDVQRAWAGMPGTLLSRDTIREMLTPQVEPHIGIGFFLSGEGGSARFGHDGSDEGFITQLTAHRERGSGFAAMSNSDYGMPVLNNLMSAVAREYGWPDFPEKARPEISLSPPETERLIGTYTLPSGARIVVNRDGDGLSLQPLSQPAFPLHARSESEFVADAVNTRITFALDGDNVTALHLDQDGMILTALRTT